MISQSEKPNECLCFQSKIKELIWLSESTAAQEVLKLVEGLTTHNYDPATLHRPLNDFKKA